MSCGIPDFRSANGIYARLHADYPDLPSPQSMFEMAYFEKNPYPFFKFAKEIFPGNFTPSISHYFIKTLEVHGKLLRNYTQNIDTLEQIAEIKNVVHCHGRYYEKKGSRVRIFSINAFQGTHHFSTPSSSIHRFVCNSNLHGVPQQSRRTEYQGKNICSSNLKTNETRFINIKAGHRYE